MLYDLADVIHEVDTVSPSVTKLSGRSAIELLDNRIISPPDLFGFWIEEEDNDCVLEHYRPLQEALDHATARFPVLTLFHPKVPEANMARFYCDGNDLLLLSGVSAPDMVQAFRDLGAARYEGMESPYTLLHVADKGEPVQQYLLMGLLESPTAPMNKAPPLWPIRPVARPLSF